jgi:hypothetical protein
MSTMPDLSTVFACPPSEADCQSEDIATIYGFLKDAHAEHDWQRVAEFSDCLRRLMLTNRDVLTRSDAEVLKDEVGRLIERLLQERLRQLSLSFIDLPDGPEKDELERKYNEAATLAKQHFLEKIDSIGSDNSLSDLGPVIEIVKTYKAESATYLPAVDELRALIDAQSKLRLHGENYIPRSVAMQIVRYVFESFCEEVCIDGKEIFEDELQAIEEHATQVADTIHSMK